MTAAAIERWISSSVRGEWLARVAVIALPDSASDEQRDSHGLEKPCTYQVKPYVDLSFGYSWALEEKVLDGRSTADQPVP